MAKVGSVQDFFKGKTIFITGATGFLGKVFVEKILRVQPNIKKLYVLLRASNSDLATKRFHNEIIGKDLFRVLRDKWGADFGSFISKKVIAVAGDVSLENFGIKDENMKSKMLEELDIIVHTAATTNFNERYDIAMGTNTLGAFNVVNFAKSCGKLEILLYVSTAYVCREAEGLIVEESLQVNQIQNGSTKLDINLEKQLIEEKLKELRAHNLNNKTITSVMKSFGLERANMYGWPNTYVFTKAMGEILLMNMKETLRLIILRPTIVISALLEPFPGWIEDARNMDFVVLNYGKRTVTSFIGNPETILDVIPVDMVVNFIIVALMAHSKGLSNNLVYHIGSSLRNPFKISDLLNVMYYYFAKNPYVDKHGNPVVITKKLTLFITRRNELNQNKESKLLDIEDLYKPYSLFKGIFDVKNTESLRMAAKVIPGVHDVFSFDPENINWKDYMMNVHFPGLIKHSIKALPIGSKM